MKPTLILLALLLCTPAFAQSPDVQRHTYDLEHKLMREAIIDRQLRNALADCIERCVDDAESGTTKLLSQGYRYRWSGGGADCNQDCVAWYLWQLERFYGDERRAQ